MADKKIYLVVTPFFPTPDNFRGSFIFDAVRAIKHDGRFHPVVFVPKRPCDRRKEYVVDGVRVHLFPMLQMPSYFFNGLTNGINGRWFVNAVRKTGIKLRNVAVCHAHVSVFGALALAVKKENTRIITLLQHHDLDPYTIRNGKLADWYPNLRYRAIAARKVFEAIDVHVSVSEAVRENLRRFPGHAHKIHYTQYSRKLRKLKGLSRTSLKGSVVLYNGVDTAIFNTNREGSERIIDKHHLKIGCIANFQDLKRHIDLLEALYILKKKGYYIEAELIGTGPELDSCKTYVATHGLTDIVKFKTEMAHAQLPDFYKNIDLFVLPSIFEGFGCVYTESWACGTPFIACEGQGAAEYIKPEDAHLWLCKQKDPFDLAAKIENFIINRPEQHLRHPIDINVLMKDFLNKLQ